MPNISFTNKYQPIPKSYKKKFPFKLGTTSFIYPDDYIPNAQMLAPYVDEVELLIFESTWPDSIPSTETIERLRIIGKETSLKYNIHLPIDVSLTASDPKVHEHGVRVLCQVIERTSPLCPSTYTLHLPFNRKLNNDKEIKKRLDNACKGLEKILQTGIKSSLISVETLEYPFEWVKPLINDFNLSICMDIGHLFLYNFDPESFYDKFSDKISIIHLHGVRDKQDHISLEKLSQDHMQIVKKILKQFKGIVSLEVFSYKNLVPSLILLDKEINRKE
ncbi:cobamide remodeling phosphodiesterase CbiR [Desulfobacterales bacterium HSG17]|nr:cobamide remodeling phosphodiesterase CbiR [Desulfobacterales bacterium HSG17]